VLKEVAMTGEITLSGHVLPVGGIKEKILAAARAGMKTVVLPAENKSQLDEIAPRRKRGLAFVLARTVEDVWKAALLPPRRGKAKP